MHPQSTEQPTPDAPRDWHFTFGAGQRFAGHYVTIHGTDAEARAEMIRRFRAEWCAMYDATRPVEVTKFPTELTELPRAQWPDPARPTVLTFGEFDLPEARLEALVTGDDIKERISDELDSAGYDLDLLSILFDDGGMSVTVLDSDDFPLGTITISQPKPGDHLPEATQDVAAHLEEIARQLRAAARQLPGPVRVTVNLFARGNEGQALDTVDALADVTGKPATWDDSGGVYGHYRTELDGGKAWTLHCHAFEKRPKTTEDALRARVAELEAQLAQGGGAR